MVTTKHMHRKVLMKNLNVLLKWSVCSIGPHTLCLIGPKWSNSEESEATKVLRWKQKQETQQKMCRSEAFTVFFIINTTYLFRVGGCLEETHSDTGWICKLCTETQHPLAVRRWSNGLLCQYVLQNAVPHTDLPSPHSNMMYYPENLLTCGAGLMWSDPPGFPLTLPVGSVVPLVETSELMLLPQKDVTRLPRGWKRRAALPHRPDRGLGWCAASARGQSSPADLSFSARSHGNVSSPSLFVFSFSPRSFFVWLLSVCVLVVFVLMKRTVCKWSRCGKPLFLQAGSRGFNTVSTWQRKRAEQTGNEALCKEVLLWSWKGLHVRASVV